MKYNVIYNKELYVVVGRWQGNVFVSDIITFEGKLTNLHMTEIMAIEQIIEDTKEPVKDDK